MKVLYADRVNSSTLIQKGLKGRKIMNLRSRRSLNTSSQCVIAIACVASLATDNSAVAQTSPQAQSQVMTTTTLATEEAPKIPNDQLDSLVAPIALYPDPLLAQVLAASTYPRRDGA
jgi:Protein of unknown function (DUF3300)